MTSQLKDNAVAATPIINDTASKDWLIWQLMDSAFPTGGFAHSNGFEAAFQAGNSPCIQQTHHIHDR
jgi:hypothetical protein